MRIKVKKIMATLNINAKEAEHGVIVAHSIEKKMLELNPNFHDKFIGYCEMYFNSIELQYQTGYQKFLILYKKFTDGYASKSEAKYKSEKEKEVYMLVGKVVKVKPAHEQAIIRGIKLDYSHLRDIKTKEPFFSKEEIEKLSLISKDIGGVLWQIESFGIDSVVETILNKLSKQIKLEVKQLICGNAKQISQNDSKVASLIKSAIKTA